MVRWAAGPVFLRFMCKFAYIQSMLTVSFFGKLLRFKQGASL